MKILVAIGLIAGVCASAAVVEAESEFFREFQRDYAVLDQDLLNHTGELATVKDFVFQKDVATFTLHEGDIHLLRYVKGRPTTAIFIGRGHARIEIPVHTERQGMYTVAGDSLIDEDFEVLFIRMGDDFDLALKEQFSFASSQLDWKMFQPAKEAQGEIFFKPVIQHKVDNYFQLLHSIYERSSDGYFWADFNRWVYTFDPNRPEQVSIGYEFEGGDVVATVGARFQRQEAGVNRDAAMSNIPYETTMLSKRGELRLSGTDGRRIDECEANISLLVNADSLRFLTLYLQFNLNLDSVYYDGSPIDFVRRRTFDFTGIILPQYVHRGDTVELTLWYEGSHFDHFMPYVDDPIGCPYEFTFTVPEGYNYYMPGMSEVVPLGGGQDQFTVSSPAVYNNFFIHAYPGGIEDTIPVISDLGITLNFLPSKAITKKRPCFIPHEDYRNSVLGAFNYMAGKLGPPANTFVEYVIPDGFQSMPGMIKAPQLACVSEEPWTSLGGFKAIAGNAVSRQWFGSLMRPATDRETWLQLAMPEFMSMMYLETIGDGRAYYSTLILRRDSLYTAQERGQCVPLAAGDRVNSFFDQDTGHDFFRTIRTNKGIWLLHMLRFLMLDLETNSDRVFTSFLRELFMMVNSQTYTNSDIVALAEKHCGSPLDWFFAKWLYGVDIPGYDVKYDITERDGRYYVPVKASVQRVSVDYTMPVIMRLVGADGASTFYREMIPGRDGDLELGPFDARPKELIFNEFYSVLSRDKVSKE